MGCNPNLSATIFNPTNDTQVIYTGPSIPALNICSGTTLSVVEAIILQKLVDYSTGIGITIPGIDLTACALFTQYITCCNTTNNTLDGLMQIIFQALCVLYNDYTTLQALVAALLNGPYNTGCLTLGSNPTLSQIIQELILEFCALKTQVATLQTQVNTLSSGLNASIGTFLAGAIQGCQVGSISKSGTGIGFQVTFSGFAPIGSILPYAGPIAGVFDSTGMGLDPGPCCGWALTNGAVQNGITTVDARGYGLVGVNDGSMGSGIQNPEVDNSINPRQNYSLNAHGGQINVALTGAQCSIPSHTHSVTDPGHSHLMSVNLDSASGAANANYMKFDTTTFTNTLDGTPDVGNIHAKVRNNTTGISIGPSSASGVGSPHENRSPYRAVYFIQRVK